MNISGIFILFAHWSDFVDRNDKAFTLLYKVVIHKKVSHPYEIQNTFVPSKVWNIRSKVALQRKSGF